MQDARAHDRQAWGRHDVALRRRDVRSGGIPFRVPAGGVVPWLALAVIAYILSSLKADEWRAAALVAAAAVALYAITARSRGARRAEVVRS